MEEGAAAAVVAAGHEVARAADAARTACSARDVRAHSPVLLGPLPCHTMAGGKAVWESASGSGTVLVANNAATGVVPRTIIIRL